MKYPSIVLRFNGDRSTDKILVRAATSRRTVSQRARWYAREQRTGWSPFLVGTFAALQEVGAFVGQGGGWSWRDDGGYGIAVEEIQP